MKKDILTVKKGPKGSSIVELNLSKAQQKRVFKNLKNEPFTVAELKFQEDGLIHAKKPVTLTEIVIGAQILRVLKSFVEKEDEIV